MSTSVATTSIMALAITRSESGPFTLGLKQPGTVLMLPLTPSGNNSPKTRANTVVYRRRSGACQSGK
jgi:hypothetical protein